jgi:DNA-binding MarR family transcriptional regulator
MEYLGNLPHIGILVRLPYLEITKAGYEHANELEFKDIKTYHSAVFQSIGDGARMTDMARKTNMTKQNMKHLLEQLETAGYVARFADETDGRAVLFKLTEKGWAFKNTLFQFVVDIEHEWAELIGLENFIQLKKSLARINEHIAKRI